MLLRVTRAFLLAGHSGVYARVNPSPPADRVATRPDGRFRVEIHGSGERMGASAGADCYAVAEGNLTDDWLRADFVPSPPSPPKTSQVPKAARSAVRKKSKSAGHNRRLALPDGQVGGSQSCGLITDQAAKDGQFGGGLHAGSR